MTRTSPYFDSPASLPFTQLKIRPTMSIAAISFELAKALIDRAIESDGSFPSGTAYLLSTSDKARNVRSAWYPMVEQMFKGPLHVRALREDALRDKKDVLFYFTCGAKVEGAGHPVRGAIADHLTSTDGHQMSALRWLEAGATGSYGTVVEPCNIPQKFPHPPVVIGRYLRPARRNAD